MLRLEYIYAQDKQGMEDYRRFLEESGRSYFQQTPAWQSVILGQGKDQSLIAAVYERKRLVGAVPLYVYSCQFGNIINSVPYPGPLGGAVVGSLEGVERNAVFKMLMEGVDDAAGRRKCILATLISSPFWPNDELYRKYFKPDFELENYTLYIDLKKPKATTSHFRNNLRRMIAKAAESHLSIAAADSAREFDEWYKLHKIRHMSLKLEPLPKSFLKRAFQIMAANKSGELFLVKSSKEIQAGCLVFYHGQVLDTYMISGSREAYQNGAIYFLVDWLIGWARERGFRYFNWQSSKPRGSGPYNFKMQWGSREALYYFFTKFYGSCDKLKSVDPELIKNAYKWHFVAPYPQLRGK